MFNKSQMTEQEKQVVEAIVLCHKESEYMANFQKFLDLFGLEQRDLNDLLDPLTFDCYDEDHSIIDDDEMAESTCVWLLQAARDVLADPLHYVSTLIEIIEYVAYSAEKTGECYGYEDRNGDHVDYLDYSPQELEEKGLVYHDWNREAAERYEEKYINILKSLIQ